jgi:hypothetical protein
METSERLLAFHEIQQLAQRYAIHLDARDLTALVGLFVEDVRVGRERQGREALHGDFDRQLRGLGMTFLHVGNHAIDLLDDETASGIVYCRAEIQDGGPDSERWIQQAIQYHDSYARRRGHWYFVRRRPLLVYGAELGQNPLTLAPAEWPRNQTGRGTVPWSLPSWRRFWGAGEDEPD